MEKFKVNEFIHFPTLIYNVSRPDLLPNVAEVTKEHLEKQRSEKEMNEIYPVVMTGDLHQDPRMQDFTKYVVQTAWDILAHQGYAVQNMSTFFTSMWAQEHFKHSAMEQHVHGFGNQLIGFYFIEVPENGSALVFHDPRAGKVMVNLPEQNMQKATSASNQIHFKPEPGNLFLANAWLPHSFSRNGSEKPIIFIHFNIALLQNPPKKTTEEQKNVCVQPAVVV